MHNTNYIITNTNSIGQFRLNGLASLNIHREVEVTVEEVIQKLSFNQKRRTDFIL